MIRFSILTVCFAPSTLIAGTMHRVCNGQMRVIYMFLEAAKRSWPFEHILVKICIETSIFFRIVLVRNRGSRDFTLSIFLRYIHATISGIISTQTKWCYHPSLVGTKHLSCPVGFPGIDIFSLWILGCKYVTGTYIPVWTYSKSGPKSLTPRLGQPFL